VSGVAARRRRSLAHRELYTLPFGGPRAASESMNKFLAIPA
jgi:hypothetical protein